jgi:hypothetical protein
MEYIPFVFSDSAICPFFVFRPEVPFGVVAMAIALMTKPKVLRKIDNTVIVLTIRGDMFSTGVRYITGIAKIKRTKGISPLCLKRKLPLFSKEFINAINCLYLAANVNKYGNYDL